MYEELTREVLATIRETPELMRQIRMSNGKAATIRNLCVYYAQRHQGELGDVLIDELDMVLWEEVEDALRIR